MEKRVTLRCLKTEAIVTFLLFLTWQDKLLLPLKAMINPPYKKSLAASLSPN